MRIKKKTSIMALAAATVAATGVAAVSFAAWTGGSANLTASAGTGRLDLVGFTGSTIAEDGNLVGDLYPVDQGTTKPADGVVSYSFSATYLATEASTLKVQSDNADISLWIKVSNAAVTAPTVSADVTAANGWQELTTTLTASNYAIPTANGAQTLHATIVLVSSDTADMDQNFTVTLNLAKTEASA